MTILDNLIARAEQCIEFGNFDSLHGELLDMVKFLDHELSAETDRAGEHFDARMEAEGSVRELTGRLAALEQAVERVRELAENYIMVNGDELLRALDENALDGTES